MTGQPEERARPESPGTDVAGASGALARLFGDLDRVDLAKLSAHLETVDLAPGDAVFHQEERGDALYVVASGRLGVYVRAETKGPAEEARARPSAAPVGTTGMGGMGATGQPSPPSPAGAPVETRVGSCHEGDLFGEMALFTEEPRSATVRAETPARVLRLPRERFLDLVRQAPALSLAIAATLSRRLRSANLARAEGEEFVARRVEAALAALPPARREAALTASLLERPTLALLAALFGAEAATVAADLAALGLTDPGAGAAVRRILVARRQRPGSETTPPLDAAGVAGRLADAGHWDQALALLGRHGTGPAFSATLARALRAVPPIDPDDAARFVERLTDGEAATDAELALARVAWLETQGDPGRALALARRALGAALVAGDAAAPHLTAEVTRLAGGDGRKGTGRLPLTIALADAMVRVPRSRLQALAGVAAALGLVALAASPASTPLRAFVCLLGAGILLMATRLLPDFAVALALVAGWVLLGLATPAQALGGFASKEWLFIVTVYGLAAAAARSGVLFRVGLLLVRRLPHHLGWQAGTLLGTGLALTPLVPSSSGRVSLAEPLALAMAEALRLPERGRTSALLGLAAWLGAGPLMYLFLNGSGTCLLAWGLLPEASRARFTWMQWLIAAGPLGLLVCLGAVVVLFLQLRPEAPPRPSADRVTLQVAVLGRPRARELLTLAVLALTVAGWIVAPRLHVDLATVALVGLLATVVIGSFDTRSFQGLDWGVIVFFGVVLSIGRLAVALGLDRAAAGSLQALLGDARPGPVVFVLAVALISVVARLVLEQDLTVLLASLTLLPLAARVGVEPWVVMIAVLATSVTWILPTQTQAYLVAVAASEGRLFSHEQARRFALGYTGVTLAALVACVPYWRWLGLL